MPRSLSQDGGHSNAAPVGRPVAQIREGSAMFFDENACVGEWRAQMRCCEEKDIPLHRNIAFALAVANVLELPDELPLMPAVTAALSVPICLSNPGSLAHLKAVACAAARRSPMKLRTDQATIGNPTACR